MLELEVKHNIAEKISVFKIFRFQKFREARRSALSSSGFEASSQIRKFIETSGSGTWKKEHPLTRLFSKNSGRWQRRSSFISPYYELGKFSRYKIKSADTEVVTGFGTFGARDVRRGRSLDFSQKLQEVAQMAQTRRKISVSPFMRRLFGATKLKQSAQIGIDYFPIKQKTKNLVIAARPIAAPVFSRIKPKLVNVFMGKFQIALRKRYEKL